MIRFMERNGYDVSYTTAADVDADTGGTLIRNHKVFMTVGHDEYWSGAQRANVRSGARRRRQHRVLLREPHVLEDPLGDRASTERTPSRRTLVSYKESLNNAIIDPQDPPTWTGNWHDPRFSPPAESVTPENALDRAQFDRDTVGTYDMKVPSQFSTMRFWRNTSVASLASGQVATYTNIVGQRVRSRHRQRLPARGAHRSFVDDDLGAERAAGLLEHVRSRHHHARDDAVPRPEWRARVRRRDRAVVVGSRPRRRRVDDVRRSSAGDGEPVRRHGSSAGDAAGRPGRRRRRRPTPPRRRR